jgi:hypothetical protein
MMSNPEQANGHLQVKQDSNGRTRSYYAYWRVGSRRSGCRLGPAHVRDTGRRTPRGAVIWRAGDGPRPTPEHLTPKDAEARLAEILEAAEAPAETAAAKKPKGSLRLALEGWLSKREREKDLKRSTVEDYEEMFERLYRDLGAETAVDELTDERLEAYFTDFKAERVLPKAAAERALAEGLDVREVEIQRWIARAPGSEPVEVHARGEAVQLAAAIGGTWKRCGQCTYRVLPPGVHRVRRVSWSTAQILQSEGWSVARRTTKRWVLRRPAMPSSRAGSRVIRLPGSAARIPSECGNAFCAVTTSTTPRKYTVSWSRRPACWRKRSGYAAPTRASAFLARPRGLAGAQWTSRRV